MSLSTGCVFDCRHLGSCVDAGVDRSRFHHTLTPTDCTTVRGKFGKAISFNGTTSYVNCGNDASLSITDAITIEAWVKFNEFTNRHRLFDRGSNYVNKHGYWIENSAGHDYITINLGNGAALSTISTNSGLLTDTWYHFVFWYDGTTLKSYINGEQQSATGSLAAPIEYEPNPKLYLSFFSAYPFNGTIDEVRIYNYALSATQIKRNYLARAYLYTEHPVRIP